MKKKARAKPLVRWEAYAPANAPHVRGRVSVATFDEDNLPEERRVEARCMGCDAPFKRTCSSRRPEDHIDRFAQVHADCAKPTEPRARVEAEAQTETEKQAIIILQGLFQHGTKHFRQFAKVDAPEQGADVLTPQRCRELLAIITGKLAPLHGISVERLTWLAGQRLSLVSAPPERRYIPVADFLEGKW